MKRLAATFYVLAGLSFLATLTSLVFGPQWIESMTGLEPDGGSGSLEALIIVLPGVAAIALAAGGYAVRRRAASTS